MGFSILKTRIAQEGLGRLLAGYLRLVRRTNRIVFEPADIYEQVRPELPVIYAMWHGQHIMIPFARPDWMPAASLVSRHGDGGFNAVALRELGIGSIRGSGALGKKIPWCSPPISRSGPASPGRASSRWRAPRAGRSARLPW